MESDRITICEGMPLDSQVIYALDVYDYLGAEMPYICLASSNVPIGEESFDILDALEGDANGDGKLDISDAVAIMQTVSNPDNYTLSALGKYNADITGGFDGVTAEDSLAIQKILLGIK